MSAQHYRLVVSGLAGTIYIAKLTKTPHLMSSDRRVVPKNEFVNCLVDWTRAELMKSGVKKEELTKTELGLHEINEDGSQGKQLISIKIF